MLWMHMCYTTPSVRINTSRVPPPLGRLTDSQGKEVDFRNTVIILTSNLGSDVLSKMKDGDAAENHENKVGEEGSEGEGESKLTRKQMAMKIVHQHFSPEFVNRLDEVVVFNSLNTEALQGKSMVRISFLLCIPFSLMYPMYVYMFYMFLHIFNIFYGTTNTYRHMRHPTPESSEGIRRERS